MKLKRSLSIFCALVLFYFPIAGIAQSFIIDVDRTNWDFGAIEVGSSVSSTVRITSIDAFSPLMIFGIDLYSAVGPPWIVSNNPFDITGLDPFTIPPELYGPSRIPDGSGGYLRDPNTGEWLLDWPTAETIDVQVAFSPLHVGFFDEYLLRIHSNHHADEYFDIIMNGTGISASSQVPEPSTMFLFVIGLLAVAGISKRKQ